MTPPVTPPVTWSVAALSLLVVGALGAAGAIALTPQAVPSALATPTPVRDVAVTTRHYDDSRTVELTLETGAERQVSAPLGGTVTSSACKPGGTLTSGSHVGAIDGRAILGMATTEPLWRDLRPGDQGDDVRALQTELARLGEPVRADGIIGTETLDAVARLLRETDEAGLSQIPADAFAWLPAPSVSTPSCPAIVGSTVDVGQPLATLPVALVGARIDVAPTDVIEGNRTVLVEGIEAEVPRGGALTDPGFLAKVAATPQFATATASAGGGEPTLPASYVLTSPLTVSIVPPAALYGLRGSTGCVASAGRAVQVRVVGSELGESFVVPPKGTRLSRVSLSMSMSLPPCR